ncbi:hypothetical protein PISL3812_07795 [Talaromyces islandicus]|uniref:Cytochrome P450 alkane hydroxylase n=1 Tax=Talaromyces islandicus TaxID=28573 RepID=A0A0U1M6T0_TALIS|nr:hypothetical protein PISL3812_07795 [Talaromyces islandicus]
MIEEILSDPSLAKVALWSSLFLIALFFVMKFRVAWEIQNLGGKAPEIPSYFPVAGDFIYQSMKARKSFKELEFWGGTMNLFTIDPENIKALLTGQFNDFGKGQTFHQEWHEFLGDSIFATDGELWSASRHLIRPMFVRDRIVDTEIFETNVQKLIQHFGGNSSPHGSKIIDVSDLYFRYTLDAATDYLLGQGTDSLENPTTVFAEAFRYVQSRQADYFRMGPLNIFMGRKKFREQLKIMDDFIQPYIDTVLSLSPDELDKKLSKRDTFLDALARFTRDPRVLRDQLVAVLLAGRDTTAGTLSFCTFELSRNPEAVAKLRAEIEDRLGVGADAQKPTYNDLKEMKYLTAVINETLRFYPVVPFNVRYSLHDTTLPRGGGPDGKSPVGVRRETRIVYSTIIMQRLGLLYDNVDSEKYFDPGKWIPERWTSGWQPKPWHFIPFNGGPRICIGQQFAMLEMGYTLVRIFQAYERVVAVPVTGHDHVEDPRLRFEVTLSPGSEMNCVFLREGEKQP